MPQPVRPGPAPKLFVAVRITHNDEDLPVSHIIDEPGFDSGLEFVDLYECNVSIRSFGSLAEANTWLDEQDALDVPPGRNDDDGEDD